MPERRSNAELANDLDAIIRAMRQRVAWSGGRPVEPVLLEATAALRAGSPLDRLFIRCGNLHAFASHVTAMANSCPQDTPIDEAATRTIAALARADHHA